MNSNSMISVSAAQGIIDFSAGLEERRELANQQIEGTVALFNILQTNNLAYLADEVGMGKTYIALGLIALMRIKQPDMRVLYLLPKNNVRDKWVKDYHSFIEYNFKKTDLIVRSIDGQPAAPFIVCHNLASLIREASMGNSQDIFICSSALSFALENNYKSLKASLKALLLLDSIDKDRARELHSGFPDDDKYRNDKEFRDHKNECKNLWALTLNRILPEFELTVVDEAHNFKRGMESSDRNRLLAQVLGTSNQRLQGHKKLLNKVLLLSATPYEHGIEELKNQLQLFGSSKLNDYSGNNKELLKPFMVRRLNEINITINNEEKAHTRNMYRIEHRTGKNAEVIMSSEQYLIAALLQKRVNEHLQENCSGKYQLGMLASFESYLPASKTETNFDGDNDERKAKAEDENIVSQLIASYKEQFKHIPPHPKMDWMVEQLHQRMFIDGKKQLIFVRRVASVTELKNKLEERYDKFIGKYLTSIKDDFASELHDLYIDKYRNTEIKDGDENQQSELDSVMDEKSSSDDFFTWFYKGKNPEVESRAADEKITTPFNFRQKIAQRSTMFELNWASLFISNGCKEFTQDDLERKIDGFETVTSDNKQNRFINAQYAYLKCLEKHVNGKYKPLVNQLLEFLYLQDPPKISINDRNKLLGELSVKTFFDEIAGSLQLKSIFPQWGNTWFKSLIDGSEKTNGYLAVDREIHKLEIHRNLIAILCRSDHPFIDLYSLRSTKEDEYSEQNKFLSLLEKQCVNKDCFSSYKILEQSSNQLDLLIKLNFNEAYHKKSGELVKYISNQIRGMQSTSGASGANSSDRSPLARRFRMPGYPMALISTDVFQEGEDLHTFCDSVTHFGLSSSPIALEQKVGRVDRIGSLNQRNLASKELYGETPEKYFINVGYPHIKESIEYIQVQNSAANLNRFIESLHEIGSSKNTINKDVDTNQKLQGIEPQITSHLTSPYKASTHFIADNSFLFNESSCYSNRLHKDITMFNEHFNIKIIKSVDGYKSIDSSTHTEYSLRAARRTNELVFSISRLVKIHIDKINHFESNISMLKLHAKQYLCRLQAINDRTKGRIFYNNVERLFDIENDFNLPYNRQIETELAISDEDNFINKCYSLAPITMLASIISNFKTLGIDQSVQITVEHNELLFTFSKNSRKQKVRVFLLDQYILFTSKAVDKDTLKENSLEKPDKIFEYTAYRNKSFDLVDFHIDEYEDLSVRAYCDKTNVTHLEQSRIAWRVAREADRVEYLFHEKDEF